MAMTETVCVTEDTMVLPEMRRWRVLLVDPSVLFHIGPYDPESWYRLKPGQIPQDARVSSVHYDAVRHAWCLVLESDEFEPVAVRDPIPVMSSLIEETRWISDKE